MPRLTRLVGVLVVVGATAGGALVTHALGNLQGAATARVHAVRVDPPPPPAPAEQRLAEEMLAIINADRAGRGLAPYAWHPAVAEAARAHSADMAAMHVMQHPGSDGSNAGRRLTVAGFTWQAWGENIAAGFTDARTLFNAWMASPGHRPQMVGNYQYIGVAVVVASDGAPYWTMVVANGG